MPPGEGVRPIRLSAPALVDLPNGPGSTLACLQPAVVVLEDVDLVAEDRSFGSGSSPVLFDLLDAMDGAAGDADLLFVLTTNRADLLEPALAARPGRVDVAIEIDLPDAEARERLSALYGRALPLHLSQRETEEIVERTDGVTASFLKEFLRRAILESLHDDATDPSITAAHTTLRSTTCSIAASNSPAACSASATIPGPSPLGAGWGHCLRNPGGASSAAPRRPAGSPGSRRIRRLRIAIAPRSARRPLLLQTLSDLEQKHRLGACLGSNRPVCASGPPEHR